MSIQVTADVVKSAISLKLSASYPTTKIYKEQVVEGLNYPSFFITLVKPYVNHLYKNKYMYEFLMNIQYNVDPKIETRYKDLDNMAVDLLETLETIELGGLNLKGKNMNSSKDEATLDFFVTYNVPAMSEEQAGILMRTLELNKEVKGE